MTTLTSLGFIGGGQMAEALIRGISEAHLLPADKILLVHLVSGVGQLIGKLSGIGHQQQPLGRLGRGRH